MSPGEAVKNPEDTMQATRRTTGGGRLPGCLPGIFLHTGGDTGADSIDPTIITGRLLRTMEGSVTAPTVPVAEVEAEGTGRRVVGAEVVRCTEFSSRVLGLTGRDIAV